MQALDHVNDCRKTLQLLKTSFDQGESCLTILTKNVEDKEPTKAYLHLGQDNKDDVPLALSVYEFDAKANLNHDDVERLLDRISKLPNTDGKTFETIAGREVNYWRSKIT